ncbi:MAG TPA: NlpC/P60 family protein [Streptosporangiaceae bacterium]|nr:NlpC/P60 family protein [Streptosporangiaceae bacterium]
MPLSSRRRSGCRADAPAAAALALTTLLGLVVATGLPPRAAGAAPPDPGADRLARSERDVRHRAAALGRVEGRLARADAGLRKAATRAEIAVERYHGGIVRLQRARRVFQYARARLAVATHRYETARAELATFAANAYRANVAYGGWTSLVGADGGPQGFMDRADLVQVMARRQAGLVERVRATEIICDMYRRRAAHAVAAQRAATLRAAAAKRLALAAVARQRAAVSTLGATRKRLAARLAGARAETARLRQARAAAAARAAAQGTGAGGHGVRLAGSGRGVVAAAAALKWLGTPYSWGGGTAAGPSYGILQGAGIKGFDCSGLALYAWARAGVRLDHWAGSQWTSGPHIPTNQLLPGDLVFFATNTNDPGTIHHVGIYVGGGRMVEAPYTGARVRVSSAWRGDLIGATRPA